MVSDASEEVARPVAAFDATVRSNLPSRFTSKPEDVKHVLVKLAKARVTPEAAMFSARGELLYHGRIDNLYISLGKARNQPTRQDLDEALQTALAERPIKEVVTPAIGCSLADIR